MTSEQDKRYTEGVDLVDQVDDLADQVKTLALNLAITLAREKSKIKDLKILEPEFTRMIHKSVGVIREITTILRTLRNDENRGPRVPVGIECFDKIETSLEEILDVSQSVLKDIRALKNRKNTIDKCK